MIAKEISAVIFCDDIRKEITNKDILIGVYGGDIVVPAFPAQFALALWIEMNPSEPGSREIAFRLSPGDAKPVELRIGLSLSEHGPIGLSIPALPIPMEEPGEIRLEVLEDGEWLLLKSKRVKRGPIVSPFGPPSSSSRSG